jgi:lipoprotein-anchoring transpeptidase ErfK/SrfK
MRGWAVGGALAALIAVAAVIAGGQISAKPPAQSGAKPRPVVAPAPKSVPASPDRDLLSAAETDTAHRAGLLPGGTKSLIITHGQLRHGEYRWDEKNVPAGRLTVWVDLRRQMISVFRGGHEIGTAVVVYGATDMESPLGRFAILSKHADYHSRSYDAPMPFSLFINRTGVALHGSPMSARHATHGCIGLPIEFAKLLFKAAKIGDQVEIVKSDPNTVQQLSAAPKS